MIGVSMKSNDTISQWIIFLLLAIGFGGLGYLVFSWEECKPETKIISNYDGCKLYKYGANCSQVRGVYFSSCGDTTYTEQVGKGTHQIVVPGGKRVAN